MIKKILIGVAVLLVIVAGGVYYLYSNLGSIIKAAIENYGTQATQSQVKVDNVKLSLTDGEGAISGLSIANPKGYSAGNAFALGSVSLKVDPASATKNPVVIKEIIIDRPQIAYEMGGQGGSNLQTIQNNVNAFAKKMGGGAAPAKPAESSTEPERKLIIESLSVRNGQIAASHEALKGEKISVGLPTINLTNIGKAKGGATPAEVANEVIGAISQQASKVAGSELQKQLKDKLGGAAKGALEGVGGAVGGSGGSGTGGSGGGVGDQLRGVLGR